MADTYKVLGQSIPQAGVLDNTYTAASGAVVSSVLVCNQGRNTAKFRISVAVAGAADTAKQYIYYDVEVFGNDTFNAVLGLTLAATDVVRCMSDTAGLVSFNVFGIEVA